jgi:hypothetical protein
VQPKDEDRPRESENQQIGDRPPASPDRPSEQGDSVDDISRRWGDYTRSSPLVNLAQARELIRSLPIPPSPPEVPPEHRGDLVHICGCRIIAVNYRIRHSVCVSCGMVVRYAGTMAEVGLKVGML